MFLFFFGGGEGGGGRVDTCTHLYTNEALVAVLSGMFYRPFGKGDNKFTCAAPVKQHLSQQSLSKGSNLWSHASKLAKQPDSFPRNVITLEAIQMRTS